MHQSLRFIARWPRPTTLLPARSNGKPEAATAVYKLLMMGMRMPETCWAVFKRRAINLRDWCIWLVDIFECMMVHGLTNPNVWSVSLKILRVITMLTVISWETVWTDGRITNKDVLGNYSSLHIGRGITSSKAASHLCASGTWVIKRSERSR